MVNAKIRITGRVQGVLYRQSTKQKARELGLLGWARNCEDGSVEVVAKGEKGSIEALIAWLWQGPPSANVNGVTVDWPDDGAGEEFENFHIR